MYKTDYICHSFTNKRMLNKAATKKTKESMLGKADGKRVVVTPEDQDSIDALRKNILTFLTEGQLNLINSLFLIPVLEFDFLPISNFFSFGEKFQDVPYEKGSKTAIPEHAIRMSAEVSLGNWFVNMIYFFRKGIDGKKVPNEKTIEKSTRVFNYLMAKHQSEIIEAVEKRNEVSDDKEGNEVSSETEKCSNLFQIILGNDYEKIIEQDEKPKPDLRTYMTNKMDSIMKDKPNFENLSPQKKGIITIVDCFAKLIIPLLRKSTKHANDYNNIVEFIAFYIEMLNNANCMTTYMFSGEKRQMKNKEKLHVALGHYILYYHYENQKKNQNK